MAYQTGTVNSMNDLKTILDSFCVTNGWVQTGDVLEKGSSYVRITNPDSERIKVEGANSTDFLTEPCAFGNVMYVTTVSFPITYYMFVHTNPDMVVCVINYEVDRIQVLMFGDIVKIDNAAYVGGNFFFASRHESYYTKISCFWYLSDDDIGGAGNDPFTSKSNAFMPFLTASRYSYSPVGMHVKIDGHVWDTSANSNPFNIILAPNSILPYHRSPNLWDSQAHLIPMNLMYKMADSLYGDLGYVEHIRLIKIDNYNIGDIVEIAPDKWKVFPWVKKETTYPNGRSSVSQADEQYALAASGTLGFAVRYDGP